MIYKVTIIMISNKLLDKRPAEGLAPKFTRNYLLIIAIITFGLGVGLVVIPSVVVGLFFNMSGVETSFFARMVGSTLIGYATLNALAAYNSTYLVCKIAVWSNLVTLLIASIITLNYQKMFDGFGWLVISQHIIFALGFMYCARQLASKSQ